MSAPRSFNPGRAMQRKALQLSPEELVTTGSLDPADVNPLPVVVSPRVDGVNLVTWAAAHRDWIDDLLARHGGLLFRGFGIDSVERFEELIAASSSGPLPYVERSSPRSAAGGGIYTSTDHPADQEIFLHNEQSYNLTFPRKIYFCCLKAADEGGATPIADCRRVFAELDLEVRRRFFEQGYMYVRNFGDGLGLSWQTAFQTSDREAVEEYCRANDIEVEWKSGGRLRARQVRPVIAVHPRTGEPTWFNHATFFHVSTLPSAIRDGLVEQIPPEGPAEQHLLRRRVAHRARGDGRAARRLPAALAEVPLAGGGRSVARQHAGGSRPRAVPGRAQSRGGYGRPDELEKRPAFGAVPLSPPIALSKSSGMIKK